MRHTCPHCGGEFAEAVLSERTDITELERALFESVKLQSHYAELLNIHDGGKRMTFTVETWLARLAELDAANRALKIARDSHERG